MRPRSRPRRSGGRSIAQARSRRGAGLLAGNQELCRAAHAAKSGQRHTGLRAGACGQAAARVAARRTVARAAAFLPRLAGALLGALAP